jgi:hypothetical protein
LALYQRVAHKALRISKTFGIEGKKLLKPEDDYEALKEFNEEYEGKPSEEEAIRLAYRALLNADESLEDRLAHLPLRVFSARAHPHAGEQAVFFCYSLPAKNMQTEEWDDESRRTQWYLFDVVSEKILENVSEIDQAIRSTPDTPRERKFPDAKLADIRKKVEAHIKNTYLKSALVPLTDKHGKPIKPVLKAWMELN